MDKIKELGTETIFELIEPVVGAFMPLLAAKQTEIEQVPRATFQYGPMERHQLDIYYPIAPHPSGRTKILVFLYGGGFVSGDRQMRPPANLAYANIGAYFARRGLITIVPDYRLVPEAVFPGPAEDVRDAIVWVTKNPQHLTTPNTPNPETQGIFLSGHSAGAVHAFTALAIPETVEPAVFRSSIAGVILCGGSYHANGMDPGDMLWGFVNKYYGGAEGLKKNVPIALLENASDEMVAALPRMVMVMAEKEPKWVMDSGEDFRAMYERRTGKKLPMILAKEHNHLSLYWAVSSGEGEDWAEEVIRWTDP